MGHTLVKKLLSILWFGQIEIEGLHFYGPTRSMDQASDQKFSEENQPTRKPSKNGSSSPEIIESIAPKSQDR